MADVRLDHVYKVYQGERNSDVTAVHDFNLHIEDKEFVVLVGPSGCGKSTTLRMIAGLEEVSRGDIFIDDRRINDVPPKDRDIAMVFQNYALYPHMTAYENMAFGLELRKVDRHEIERRVRDAALSLGLTDDELRRKPKALSGGQRQRVAVGRAIVRQPKAFLFDEPLSNLDAKMRVAMRTEISKLHLRLATTMVYVTHDQIEAMTMGDRIVVMKDGVIQQVADPLTVYSRPTNRFVASFIGSPPMNFIEGTLITESGHITFIEAGPDSGSPLLRLRLCDEHAARLAGSLGNPVTLGLRPEDLHDRLFHPSSGPDTSFPATADVVEPMGAETYLYLSTAQHTLVARYIGHHRIEIHSTVHVVTDMKKACFFDPKTGLSLL
jgi:multiple sugar transport system ATP-binding protein